MWPVKDGVGLLSVVRDAGLPIVRSVFPLLSSNEITLRGPERSSVAFSQLCSCRPRLLTG